MSTKSPRLIRHELTKFLLRMLSQEPLRTQKATTELLFGTAPVANWSRVASTFGLVHGTKTTHYEPACSMRTPDVLHWLPAKTPFNQAFRSLL